MIDLHLDPDKRALRTFGLAALVVFGGLGVLLLVDRAPFSFGGASDAVGYGLVTVGGLSGLFSAVWPRGNRALYIGLTLVAFPIGFVVSYLILGIIFFLVITPIGLVFRVMRRDKLKLRFDRSTDSYWVQRPTGPVPPSRYFNQY